MIIDVKLQVDLQKLSCLPELLLDGEQLELFSPFLLVLLFLNIVDNMLR